jgi:hypothetical protein
MLHAQTADELTEILETKAVTLAQASRFVLVTTGAADEGDDAGAVYALARQKGWLPENSGADDTIRLGDLSFLIMQAFGMKSGFMYALVPSPRYAYREMVYRRLLQGRNDPALTVSGDRLLRIIGRVLDYRGDSE